MANVEISLSEAFQKHKRNLLLLCSAITVLRLASPAKLKLPFVGAEVELPSTWAFGLLLVTLIYMFVQYYIEYITMKARHSSEIIDSSKPSVDEVISDHLKHMEGWVHKLGTDLMTSSDMLNVSAVVDNNFINHVAREFQTSLKNRLIADAADFYLPLKDTLQNPSDEKQLSFFTHSDRQIRAAFDDSIKKLDDHFSSVRNRLTNVVEGQATIADNLAKYTATYNQVASSFKLLSSNIGIAQRRGFKYLDGYLVIGFSFLALVACVTGSIGLWIKPPLPVVAAPPASPLPPASTKG